LQIFSLLSGIVSFKIINQPVYMGAGYFGDTLLQIIFLPTYTWTWSNVCRVFKLIRLLWYVSSSKFWTSCLNNVILEVASNM